MGDDLDRIYERVLVLRCQAGDQAAFAELVERYQPRLRLFVRKMLDDVPETDDAIQDVWLDVFRHVANLRDLGGLAEGGWRWRGVKCPLRVPTRVRAAAGRHPPRWPPSWPSRRGPRGGVRPRRPGPR